jgi:electron transfer flavoprotein alpha subunit
MATIFAYVMHQDGQLHDSAAELRAAARVMDPTANLTAILAGQGAELASACAQATAIFEQVWKIDHADLARPNAEIIRPLLSRLIPQGSVLLLAHEHFGMDLAPGLSVKLSAAYLPDVVALSGGESGRLQAVREEYAGMARAHLSAEIAQGVVVSLRPGAFAAEANAAAGEIVDKTQEAAAGGWPTPKRRYLESVVAEAGDVDITKSETLVSVGRGIEDEDNLEIAFALAKALGAEVSCSRPIVDAKWLEKGRQVGTSGKTVKPKIYIACGISGSSQHLGGLKGAPLVIALNKNPKAPIFQRADVGVVTDILKFMPLLTKAVSEAK